MTQGVGSPPSPPDFVGDLFDSAQRNALNGDPDGGFLGLEFSGDSLFANVTTAESLEFVEQFAAEAEAAGFDLDTPEGQDELFFLAEDAFFVASEPDDPFATFIPTNRFTGAGIDIAESELGPGDTIAEGRIDQVLNNSAARIAEIGGFGTFVNNDVSPDDTGPIVLTFNPVNPLIDGGEQPGITATNRDPINFTFEEITSSAPSVSEFQAGDTLTLPANIRNEAFTAQGISEQANGETSLGFNADGSTFDELDEFAFIVPLQDVLDDPSVVDAAGEDELILVAVDDLSDIETPEVLDLLDFGIVDNAILVDEPNILIGDRNSVQSVTGREGGEEAVASLHTQPLSTVSFFPLADDLFDFTLETPPEETLPDPNEFTEPQLFESFAPFGTEDPAELPLVSAETFEAEFEETLSEIEVF